MTYESHTNHISYVLGRHLQAGCFTPADGRFYTCKQGPYSVRLPKDCHFGRSVGVVRDLKG